MTQNTPKRINIAEIVGKGYSRYWNDKKHRYVVCKGSRGSKKSKTTALWIIYNMMKYPLANTLVVRKTFATHRDSTYADLQWACEQLGVSHLWSFPKSEVKATYKPTGQQILFRGMDDTLKVTSITVSKGHLCWAWFEEAYECDNEEDFDKIDMSIRGELPPDYFYRIMVTFNPWSEKHWLKKRFFDTEDDMVLSLTTNYLCNEWIGKDFIKQMEQIKKNNPNKYKVVGLGEWGISEGLIFENWQEDEFDLFQLLQNPNNKCIYGLDWGYNDPTAFICAIVNTKTKELYIYDEHYQRGMTNDMIVTMIRKKNYHKAKIICDSNEPRAIAELRKHGINAVSAKKGKGSIMFGINRLLEYKIYVNPKCLHTIVELSNYQWDVKEGKDTKPIDNGFCHLIDALRYAMETINTGNRIQRGVSRRLLGI